MRPHVHRAGASVRIAGSGLTFGDCRHVISYVSLLFALGHGEATNTTGSSRGRGGETMAEPEMLPVDAEEEVSWQERALCAQTDPEAFFPEKGGSTREAKRVCTTCEVRQDRKSTRLNSSHVAISYAVF